MLEGNEEFEQVVPKEEEEEEAKENNGEISIHALYGVTNSKIVIFPKIECHINNV